MSVNAHRSARLGRFVLLAVTLAAGGCNSLNNATNSLAGMVTPYRVEVVQGNFVSREQVEALQPGMSREQVREILGTPLVTSLFHANRWDYVFTIKRPGEQPQTRRLTVFFENDVLQRYEGDPMPSETEFVASLGKQSKPGKVPPLEATPEQLARYPAPPRTAASEPAAEDAAAPPGAAASASSDAPPVSYPPLESSLH
ncbi:outer membrane protein assembly factor BamE [Extensimonas vulgaris]|uniref:Outer membrane protein assembly factor BamE n=1 Tax=Extensimonas vulgaris TaxID=1031594 RepID=A0A369ARV8_9BURK|nr:outer membrane protein assembly factor BamE [Extensimonas vulgaris]RCX10947.1 Beta-barrel assembly machine subunit BamE [Extensimonas vulgaris]TWI41621.1 Beta-barrel assembly machine subunit BamE [Extensimonas vulgaris]TXD16094.1 outer membrane protein assembly factor BamE [Extensimonas vulgaris]